MKKLLLSFALLLATFTFAQTPESINYQAVVRDSGGSPLAATNVGVQIAILEGAANGTAVYTETHTTTTSDQGLINLQIGAGTTTDDLSTIDWSANSYFVQLGVDTAGGTNYAIIGTTQLLSVPYALYAKNASGWEENANGVEYDNGDVIISEPGSSLVLTSPNGTQYELTVNDAGELSLPTSNQSSNTPTSLYLYGSFNGWDAANALQLTFNSPGFSNGFLGYKYFAAGTEVKFLAAQNESVVYGGNGISGNLDENAGNIQITNSGFYRITVFNGINYQFESVNVEFYNQTMSYDVGQDEFSIATANWSNGINRFQIGFLDYGDNLGDGTIEVGGATIDIPSGYARVGIDLTINFNGSGTYTMTSLPAIPAQLFIDFELFGPFEMTQPSLGVFTIALSGASDLNFTFVPQTTSNDGRLGGTNGMLIVGGPTINSGTASPTGDYIFEANFNTMTYSITPN